VCVISENHPVGALRREVLQWGLTDKGRVPFLLPHGTFSESREKAREPVAHRATPQATDSIIVTEY